MARIGRIVAPDMPHHVTQRGNRRLPTFFGDEDYVRYLDLMAEWCAQCGVAIWGYCLMPNHVHLIAVPRTEDGLCRAIGEAEPMLSMIDDWPTYLAMDIKEEEAARIRLHERTGRPLGNPDWLTGLENILKRPVTPQKRGLK